RALRLAVGGQQDPGAHHGPAVVGLHHGDECAAAALTREPCELGLQAQRSYRSTNTSISPPHGSPTSHASESAMPKCRRRASPPLISSATSTTAPSTQPPETAPTTSPASLTAILDPGGSGADLRVATTVASATRLPPAAQSSAWVRTSLMQLPPPSCESLDRS